jgi:predicted secreted protein
LAPQRGTVHATVSAQGRAAEPVFEKVATGLAAVSTSIDALHHPKRGPVIRYAIDQVRTGSHRPWNAEGKQLALVHTAAVSITAVFTDFGELAAWVAAVAGIDGVGIGHINWELTDAKRREVERKSRQKAVRDAKRRAQDYADALDLGTVRVRRISDPGLVERPMGKVFLARSMAEPADGAPQFELRPEEITIAAEVEATFTVPAGV